MASLQDRLDTLTSDVAAITSAEQAAVNLINGIPQLIKDAVATALAAGATPDQLAAFDDLNTKLAASASDLAAAVTANTPAAPAS